MKSFKVKVITIFILLTLIWTALSYLNFSKKKPYNYQNYYVEVKADTYDKEVSATSLDKELSLDLLKKINSDVVGIIEFPNRVIYEPIVKASDNEYYVRKNIEKKYSNAGIPFISCDGDIFSKNVVIYGHSSKIDNIIFTPLMNYLDYNFYINNKHFDFITEYGTRTYEIFAVLNIDLNNLNDSLEFTYSTWDSKTDFDEFIDDTIKRSLYSTNVTVLNSDKLITLVTCDTRDDNKRIVVIGKQIS